MNNYEITAVLFDWDLTLARILGEVSPAERTAAVFNQGGILCTPGQMQQAMNVCKTEPHLAKSLGCAKKPQTRREIMQYYKQLLVQHGYHDISRAMLNTLYSAYGHLPTYLYEDALPLLDKLQQQGYRLGIISNHAISARATMERFVSSYIPPENIIISQEEDVHKPAKTIYKRAAARLRVHPAECVLIGDNLCVDAIGAVERGNFGMGLWLDRKGLGTTKQLPQGVARITTLQQVTNYLA